MPELPEVQTVISTLKELVLNKKIKNINIIYSNTIDGNIDEFKKNVIGFQFIDITRYAKYLIFHLNNNMYIVSHLRMEGKYYYKKNSDQIVKHEHVIFELENGMTLRYHDVRKFGKMILKTKENLFLTPPLNKVGLEPFDKQMTKEYLYSKINKFKTAIKTVLLSQDYISGLGNIYVDEVLFESRILPNRSANSLNIIDCDNIIKNSIKILNKAILEKGTTIRSYTSSLNVIGNYQNFLLVHTKDVCPICGKKIDKMKIGGRTTYYCSNCQL